MTEYGNAIAVPTIGMTLEVDPQVMKDAELTLAFNYAKAQQEYPELMGHPYRLMAGPVYESYEEYEDPVTLEIETRGVGPIVGFTKQIGWYVNTEETQDAPN